MVFGRSRITRTLVAAGVALGLAGCVPDWAKAPQGAPDAQGPVSQSPVSPSPVSPSPGADPVLPQVSGTAPVVMICAFQDGDGMGWVPEVVIVTRQANGRVEVFDPILQALVGRPIKAEVTGDSPRERRYGWALAGVRNAVGQWADRLDFELRVIKADSRALLSVKAQGYDNTITGNGICGQPPQRRD